MQDSDNEATHSLYRQLMNNAQAVNRMECYDTGKHGVTLI